MIVFHGQVATTAASLYLNKLCKHFRHKVEVTFDDQQADVRFPFGRCQMLADAQQLQFHCEAEDELGMSRVRFVLDDHLQRFAQKDGLSISWQVEAGDAD